MTFPSTNTGTEEQTAFNSLAAISDNPQVEQDGAGNFWAYFPDILTASGNVVAMFLGKTPPVGYYQNQQPPRNADNTAIYIVLAAVVLLILVMIKK